MLFVARRESGRDRLKRDKGMGDSTVPAARRSYIIRIEQKLNLYL
jgi:hypothetical protein